jgi:hypothetical protein
VGKRALDRSISAHALDERLDRREAWLPDDENRWRAYLDTDDELVADLKKMVDRTRVERERLAAATER